MARPKKNITVTAEKTVEKMASIGATNLEIAELLGINERSVRRNYAEFLTKGRGTLKEKLRRKQISIALKGNVTMLIWLGKQYLGQAEKVDNNNKDSKLEVVVREVKCKK